MTSTSRFVGKYCHVKSILLRDGDELHDVDVFIDEHFIAISRGDEEPDLINIDLVGSLVGVRAGGSNSPSGKICFF